MTSTFTFHIFILSADWFACSDRILVIDALSEIPADGQPLSSLDGHRKVKVL